VGDITALDLQINFMDDPDLSYQNKSIVLIMRIFVVDAKVIFRDQPNE
jgi:hypothetical protein